MAAQLAELIEPERLRVESYFDMRYAGQDFTLPVPVAAAELEAGDLAPIRRRFDEVHQRRYGHAAPDEQAEVVNLRVTGIGRREKARMAAPEPARQAAPPRRAPVHFSPGAGPVDAPIHDRDELAGGTVIDGPALIEEYASTTVLFDGDRATVAPTLELLIDVRGAAR
jgi:N-methylhydantoinase A